MKFFNRFIIFSLALVILVSCERPIAKPDHLIPKSTFIDILTETYLIKSMNPSMIGRKAYDVVEQEAYILQKYEVSWEDFKGSYGYYMLDKKSEENIYKAVRKNLKNLAPNFEEEKDKKKPNSNAQTKTPVQKPNIQKLDNRKRKDSIKKKTPKPGILPK